MAHSRKQSESPPLMFNEPMLLPVEPDTCRKPNPADWTWEDPSPLLQPPIAATSPHSLDPYEHYSSPRRDSKRYSQWQPPPTTYASFPHPPPPQSYYQVPAKRRHSKNSPQHVSQVEAYQMPYDSGYGSSSSSGLPQPSLHPGVQFYAQPAAVPFMYRRRDALLSPNHRY